MSFRIARFLIRLVYRLIARIQVIGAEHRRGMVVVTNHIGRLDIRLPACRPQDIIMLVAEVREATRLPLPRSMGFGSTFNADSPPCAARRLERGGVLVIAGKGAATETFYGPVG
jgi:hypothetical protein